MIPVKSISLCIDLAFGLLQPIAGEPYPGSKDRISRHIELMRSAFTLEDEASGMWGLSRRECVSLQAEDKEPELLERIYHAHEKYQQEKGIVLIEGTHKGTQ